MNIEELEPTCDNCGEEIEGPRFVFGTEETSCYCESCVDLFDGVGSPQFDWSDRD